MASGRAAGEPNRFLRAVVLLFVIVLSRPKDPTNQGVLSLCPVLPMRAVLSKPLASALRLCSSAPRVSSRLRCAYGGHVGKLVSVLLFLCLSLETGIEAAVGA